MSNDGRPGKAPLPIEFWDGPIKRSLGLFAAWRWKALSFQGRAGVVGMAVICPVAVLSSIYYQETSGFGVAALVFLMLVLLFCFTPFSLRASYKAWRRHGWRANVALSRRTTLGLSNTCPVNASTEPPGGYEQPATIWLVEYVDPREPAEGSHQVGAFQSEEQAQVLADRLRAEGFFADLRLNMVPVHRTVADWEWDR